MLILDTSVIVAAADRADPWHTQSARLPEAETGPIVTTAIVIAESAYLIDLELGPMPSLLYQSIIRCRQLRSGIRGSTTRSTPRSASRSAVRSQGTGEVTCRMSRRTASGPDSTTAPSAFDTRIPGRGSCGSLREAVGG